MPPIETILAVTLAGFALSATPGPSMLYVLSRSMGQNRYAGLASALGLSLGGILLAVATALGLAAIFERYEWIVITLRYAGSAYLIWLGAGMILNASKSSKVILKVHAVENLSFSSIVWQGVWVELLNPKTVLFFALFLPPFVSAGAGEASVQAQLLILGILVPLTAIPSDIVIAWVSGLLLMAIALNLHLQFI
jgi:threonine/homoserine/homoserine lactone efflux protein